MSFKLKLYKTMKHLFTLLFLVHNLKSNLYYNFLFKISNYFRMKLNIHILTRDQLAQLKVYSPRFILVRKLQYTQNVIFQKDITS